jgi:hypothetical protein
MEGQNLVVCGCHDSMCAWAREWASNSSTWRGWTQGLERVHRKVCYDGKLETVTALAGTHLGEGLTRTFQATHS